MLPFSTTILLVLSLAISVTTTASISPFAVTWSGTVVSEIILSFESVNKTLSPDIITLFSVPSVLVIVKSVRYPLSATRTTFSLDSDVKEPLITNVGLFVADAPLSISIPLLALVPLNPRCKSITSTLPPLANTPPYLKPVIDTLFNITVAPS